MGARRLIRRTTYAFASQGEARADEVGEDCEYKDPRLSLHLPMVWLSNLAVSLSGEEEKLRWKAEEEVAGCPGSHGEGEMLE